jgi:hypothetical protein
MNTSLGNVLVMCMLLYSYLDPLKIFYQIFDNGDDCVLLVEAADYNKVINNIENWFREMGVTLKIEGVAYSIHDIEFCQQKLYYQDGRPKLTPIPGRRLYNDLVTDKPIASRKMWRKWLGAVAGGGNIASSGTPVFQSFYQWLSRSAPPYTPKEGDIFYRYRDQHLDKMERVHREISWSTRWSFYEATGIHPQAQLTLEELFGNAEPLTYQLPRDVTVFKRSLMTALVPSTLKSEHT